MPTIQEADFPTYVSFLHRTKEIEDTAFRHEFDILMDALDSILPLHHQPFTPIDYVDKMFALECLLSEIQRFGSSQIIREPETGKLLSGGATDFIRDCYQAYFIRLADTLLLLHAGPVALPKNWHPDHGTFPSLASSNRGRLRHIIDDFLRELDRHLDMNDLTYEYKAPQQLLHILSFMHAHGLHKAYRICERAFKIRVGHHWSVAYRVSQHLPSLDLPDIEMFRLSQA